MNCEKLYFLRHRNGLTQTEMGLIVGVKKYSICNWENGNEIIPLSKLNIPKTPGVELFLTISPEF